jgi:hypothetical protein
MKTSYNLNHFIKLEHVGAYPVSQTQLGLCVTQAEGQKGDTLLVQTISWRCRDSIEGREMKCKENNTRSTERDGEIV